MSGTAGAEHQPPRRKRVAAWGTLAGLAATALVIFGIAQLGNSRSESSAGAGTCGEPTAMTSFKVGSIGARYNAATNTVSYGRAGADGSFDMFLANADGTNERPFDVPSAGWLPNRHHWIDEWHPSGQYVFAYIEKNDYVFEPDHVRIPADAIPGYGAYTDIWVARTDGSQAWPLVVTPNDYDGGVIHSAVSPDGTHFAWSERIRAPDGLGRAAAGSYVIRYADFVLSPTPHLENIRTFQPGGVAALNELDGISPDNRNIAFYSSYETADIFHTPIYTLDVDTAAITQLTDASTFYQAPHYTPDGRSIVYMTGRNVEQFQWPWVGADWWIMNVDGSNKRRLTFMGVRNNPQSVNQYRLAGTISFLDNTRFLGDVMDQPLGLHGNIAMVRMHCG